MDHTVDHSRRRFLLASVSAFGAAGAVAIAIPFIRSWNPNEQAKAAGAPVTVDISNLVPGQLLIVEWRGKPIYLSTRDQAALNSLGQQNDALKDPNNSNKDQQPEFADNPYRARKKELLILEAVCTHLGCAPKYFPQPGTESFDPHWKGGFFCPCHGSRFDMAGRVLKGSPAMNNLRVPPYVFKDQQHVIIGIDHMPTSKT